jgi:hypothetical protein
VPRLAGCCLTTHSSPPYPRYSKFADLPPGHGNEWECARKTLTPTEAAFEERLEVAAESGFTPYDVIREKLTALEVI